MSIFARIVVWCYHSNITKFLLNAGLSEPMGRSPRGGVGAFLIFGRTVNPISTRCVDYAHHSTTSPPGLCPDNGRYVTHISHLMRGGGRLCPTCYYSPPPDFQTFRRPLERYQFLQIRDEHPPSSMKHTIYKLL